MTHDPATSSVPDTYRLLTSLVTPRPIAWVSTLSPAAVPNLAPSSFFNAFGANPYVLVFSPTTRRDGSKKDAPLNLESLAERVINTVAHSLAAPINATAAELPHDTSELPHDTSEFPHAGLTATPSQKVRPPRVALALAHLECTVLQIIPNGSGPNSAKPVIAQVQLFHVSDTVLTPNHEVDPQKLDTLSRLGGNLYATTRDTFAINRP